MSGISLSGRSDLKAAEVEFCDLGIGEMGRGVSCGGGQSSLGYLFGSGEAPKPAKEAPKPAKENVQSAPSETKTSSKPNAPAQPVDISKQIPAGINTSTANNYVRTDGQNWQFHHGMSPVETTLLYVRPICYLHLLDIQFSCVDYATESSPTPWEDRPSTKVHAAPGGGSFLVTCLVATKGDFKTASLIGFL
ncbi:UNVERIFIED_CONTAM: protein SPIRAL1-like 1 [Sesamum calycinum]|uniref:Protein SPIRAL1-like 1 n=1 Tax=Sesamum calycinum TaxID=2727403 RepID=A0AAW2QWV6_9LAMI